MDYKVVELKIKVCMIQLCQEGVSFNFWKFFQLVQCYKSYLFFNFLFIKILIEV